MDKLSLEAVIPDDSVGSVAFPACPEAAENSGPVPAAAIEVDVVPTSKVGKHSRNLRLGTELSRVRGYETKRELVRLHCFEGKSLPECARIMGRSYKGLHGVWRLIVAESSGERGGIDFRKQVKAKIDNGLWDLIRVAKPLVEESAAYGAVVLKAYESLRSLHGVDGVEENEATGMTLEEIGASVRVVSPLLADKLERVKALGFGKVAEGFNVAKE